MCLATSREVRRHYVRPPAPPRLRTLGRLGASAPQATRGPAGESPAARERRLQRREDARDEDAIRTLAGFVRRFWSIVEPAKKLVWNWHYDLLCDELERVARGEVNELVICVPPGTGKSILVSAMFPAWLWLHRGAEKILALSHDPTPVVRDSLRMRRIISSPMYRRILELVSKRNKRVPWDLSTEQYAKVNFENSDSGNRLCKTIGGGVTGNRVDGIILDDPYDVKKALLGSPVQVATRMNEVITVYDDVLASRVDPIVGWRIVIMQRVHEGDLAGALLKRGVRSVVLPMEFDPDIKYRHPEDPRTKPGELMFELRYSRAWCDKEKSNPTGARKWQSQYQQSPTPAAGSLFQRDWLNRRYPGDPQRFARGLRELAISVDCAFKDGRKSDYVAMQVWGRDGQKKYLLDQKHARMDLPATAHALLDLSAKWPTARLKLVESAANGPGVVALLKKSVHSPGGFVEVTPEGGKYARAQTAAVAFEAEEVYLPMAEFAPWIGDFIEEVVSFPHGTNDDQVDAMSQLFIRWDGPAGSDPATRALAQFDFLSGR